jgi:hypothetical protein
MGQANPLYYPSRNVEERVIDAEIVRDLVHRCPFRRIILDILQNMHILIYFFKIENITLNFNSLILI